MIPYILSLIVFCLPLSWLLTQILGLFNKNLKNRYTLIASLLLLCVASTVTAFFYLTSQAVLKEIKCSNGTTFGVLNNNKIGVDLSKYTNGKWAKINYLSGTELNNENNKFSINLDSSYATQINSQITPQEVSCLSNALEVTSVEYKEKNPLTCYLSDFYNRKTYPECSPEIKRLFE